jgi:nucleotide-binding universal stress UspA family protein
MYEKILVPLDGSKRAEMIRPHVRELASRFQAKVILIMVVEYTYAE